MLSNLDFTTCNTGSGILILVSSLIYLLLFVCLFVCLFSPNICKRISCMTNSIAEPFYLRGSWAQRSFCPLSCRQDSSLYDLPEFQRADSNSGQTAEEPPRNYPRQNLKGSEKVTKIRRQTTFLDRVRPHI